MKKIIVHIKSEAVECYSQYPFGGELANYVNRKLEYLQNTINNIDRMYIPIFRRK